MENNQVLEKNSKVFSKESAGAENTVQCIGKMMVILRGKNYIIASLKTCTESWVFMTLP